jgi:hypothetical protein
MPAKGEPVNIPVQAEKPKKHAAADIREWAKSANYPISAFGAIPAYIRYAYEESHRDR